jgi:hypothetical protein
MKLLTLILWEYLIILDYSKCERVAGVLLWIFSDRLWILVDWICCVDVWVVLAVQDIPSVAL